MRRMLHSAFFVGDNKKSCTAEDGRTTEEEKLCTAEDGCTTEELSKMKLKFLIIIFVVT